MKNTKWIWRIVLLIFVTMVQFGQATTVRTPSDFLISAHIKVESSGRDDAIGDKKRVNKAHGSLQIRQPCVDDVNRHYHTNYRAIDCLNNRKLSVEIYRKYVMIYATVSRLGHEPTDEDFARIWNGGPNGWKSKATESYFAKIESAKATFTHGIPVLLAVN